MPLYEYKCSKCNKIFEFLEKINAQPKTICPQCDTPTLKRKISPAGFQLKGTGWYVTDFKDKKTKEKKKEAPTEKSEVKSNKKTNEKKAEIKKDS